MSNYYKNKNRGFIKAIIIVVIAIIILSYFMDFKSLFESKRLQDNYQYLKTLILSLWGNYISSWAHYLWDKIIIQFLYEDIFLQFIWPKIRLKAP